MFMANFNVYLIHLYDFQKREKTQWMNRNWFLRIGMCICVVCLHVRPCSFERKSPHALHHSVKWVKWLMLACWALALHSTDLRPYTTLHFINLSRHESFIYSSLEGSLSDSNFFHDGRNKLLSPFPQPLLHSCTHCAG